MTESFVENKNFKEIEGYYGSGRTPCIVFVYLNERKGYAYYCVENGLHLNKTTEIDTSTLNTECKDLRQFKRRILA